MHNRIQALLVALMGVAALTATLPAAADDDRRDDRRWDDRGWEGHDRGRGHYKHKHRHHYRDRTYVVVREAPVYYERRVVYERPYYSYRRDPAVVIDLPSIVIPIH